MPPISSGFQRVSTVVLQGLLGNMLSAISGGVCLKSDVRS